MNNKERVFHAVLFEALALAIIIPIASLATGSKSTQLVIVGVGMSLFTVVWNYVYNLIFDKYVPGERSNRSLLMRIGHAMGFEAGLILLTIPTIAWFLSGVFMDGSDNRSWLLGVLFLLHDGLQLGV